MISAIVEATNGPNNWGKFLVGRFDLNEQARRSAINAKSNVSLLQQIGWDVKNTILVLDLQTGEGAMFRPGGVAKTDLNKHPVWVCPMFEPFLGWLYKQDLSDLEKLPRHIDLPDAPFAMQGYRRRGDLYEIAKEVCHKFGMDWTDPRTGETHKAPKQ